ncbi:MAG: MerR family transcriptional regulator [Micromonosporaceae bacterium]
MPEDTANLSIGQVAERTGLSVHALRFYERERLLATPVRRDSGGRRVYSENDVEWLMLCIMLRASAMPLTAIRQYTGLVREGAGNETERLALLREHQEQVTAQIAELNRCLDLINFKVGVYEDIVADCAGAAAVVADSASAADPADDGVSPSHRAGSR